MCPQLPCLLDNQSTCKQSKLLPLRLLPSSKLLPLRPPQTTIGFPVTTGGMGMAMCGSADGMSTARMHVQSGRLLTGNVIRRAAVRSGLMVAGADNLVVARQSGS